MSIVIGSILRLIVLSFQNFLERLPVAIDLMTETFTIRNKISNQVEIDYEKRIGRNGERLRTQELKCKKFG